MDSNSRFATEVIRNQLADLTHDLENLLIERATKQLKVYMQNPAFIGEVKINVPIRFHIINSPENQQKIVVVSDLSRITSLLQSLDKLLKVEIIDEE